MPPESDSDQPPTAELAQVNLYPERRQKRKTSDEAVATDTSKFSRHSETPETQVEKDLDDTGHRALKKPRQTVLRVKNGSVDIGKAPAEKQFFNPIKRNDDRRQSLKQCAHQTKLLLPGLLATRPDVTIDSWCNNYPALNPQYCPKYPPVKIVVANCDSIDATHLVPIIADKDGYKPVAVLNMANAKVAGGGWEYGAMAQEEALCFRSSLSFTLHKTFYPVPEDHTIYSPTVMVIRENFESGHDLVDLRDPSKLHVVSIISCAAVCRPETRTDRNGDLTYALPAEMTLMVEKMRNILRTAVINGHRQIVLGAFGCGAFGNPKHKVARLWRIVLQEKEFSGGWWTDIVFAVLGGSGDSLKNYWAFYDQLHDVEVR